MTKDTDSLPLDAEQGAERRRYFRIEDRVGLVLTPIPAEDEERAIAAFGDEGTHASLSNELRALRDAHLPQRRTLERKMPSVAAYLRIIERQVDMLAMELGDDNGYAKTPNMDVDLSAQGLCFDSVQPLEFDTLIEVKLTLFPDICHIKALGRVVRGLPPPTIRGTALELTYLRDPDREAIIRHVHLMQRLSLQAHAEERYERDSP